MPWPSPMFLEAHKESRKHCRRRLKPNQEFHLSFLEHELQWTLRVKGMSRCGCFLVTYIRYVFLLVKQVKSPSSTCKKINSKLPGKTIKYRIYFLFLLSTFSSLCLGRRVVSKRLYHSPHYLNTFYWSPTLWAKDYFQSDVNEHQEMGWCKKMET